MKAVLPVIAMSVLSMFCLAFPARAGQAPLPKTQFPEPVGELSDIVLAGGCFWCTEAVFQAVKGTQGVESGYAGGSAEDATYEKVSTGKTGHAEAVRIVYDPKIVNLGKILQIFFSVAHDPTQLNRQGADVGTQYRSAVFVKTKEQRRYVEDYIAQLNAAKVFEKPIVTTVEDLKDSFYPAEKYHQNYADQNADNPYIQGQALPKVDKLKKLYPDIEKKAESEGEESVNKTTGDAADFFADKKGKLTKMQCHVTQEDGTEPAFQNAYWNNHEDGIYVDVVSGEPLFSSTDKYDSGSGWPSFTRPIDEHNIQEKSDTRFGMERVEVRSSKANSHLGHVFEDGPKAQGGLRYCINSAALRFVPKADLEKEGYGKYLALFP